MGIEVDGANQKLILDSDGDTYLEAATDDTIKFYVSGAHDLTIGANAINVLSGTTLTIDSGATITNSGTANGFSSANPASADGDTLGTASLEWSDLFLADGGIIKFGNDQDVLLTHVADTGLLLNGTNVIQFNDASQNIGAPSNAILDINATDEIELNATLVDINANVEISGTATTTGVHTFTAVPVFPNNTVETADIQDNAVTLAKMAGGTDGNIISYDASGDPVAIATGNDGQVLTSTGAGSPPAFEDASGGAWAVKTSGSVSNASALDITGISKYTIIYLTNVRTSSDVQFRTSTEGGSSFDAGASDYNTRRQAYDTTTNDQPQISTVGEAYSDTSEDDCAIIVTLPRPAGTSQTLLKWEMIHNNNTSLYYRFGFGLRKSAADVDAVRIMGNSGNITASYVVVELN